MTTTAADATKTAMHPGRAAVVLGRFRAGESFAAIAADFDILVADAEDAVRAWIAEADEREIAHAVGDIESLCIRVGARGGGHYLWFDASLTRETVAEDECVAAAIELLESHNRLIRHATIPHLVRVAASESEAAQ